MNNPASTILQFASVLEDDPSIMTPLLTERPQLACTHLADPPPSLSTPTTLHTLITTIISELSSTELPLDPTLPLLQTPSTTPLKLTRASAASTPLLPQTIVASNPFPAFLAAQAEHLTRISHYNFVVLELTPQDVVTHSASDFCAALVAEFSNRARFRARFGVYPTEGAAIALLSALKTAREAVVPVGDSVFVHARCGGEKIKARNDAFVKRVMANTKIGEKCWYRRFRGVTLIAWGIILLWVGIIVGVGAWDTGGSAKQAFLDCIVVLQLGVVLAMLVLGVGKQFWAWSGLLTGWRAWTCERDVVRDISHGGRDALVAGLLSGALVDDLVSGFGIGEGDVRLREWVYDPRFGIVVGEKNAFCIRGRRWYRVEKEVITMKGEKQIRYRLFLTGVKKAFVGIGAGVIIIDGGTKDVV